VKSDAYRLHLIYGALAFGSFKSEHFLIKGELLAGEVRTDLVWNSQLEVQASTQDGHQVVSASIPLKYEPFMVYGVKGTLQWGIGRSGAVRFQASIECLRGKSDIPSQSITFNTLPGSILIAAPDLQLLNVNAGLHFTLHHSRNPKE
jgi:hypothetical protein